MKTTIVMPVSRKDFIPRIFAQLDMMNFDSENTNLLCYVDGTVDLFAYVRDFVVESRFKEKLCVYRKKGLPNISHIRMRRQRIADIHNEMKAIVGACDYVFLIEDDTLLPLNALEKLLRDYGLNPYAGFISGVQVGRWGFTVPGVWRVDNPYNVKTVQSMLPSQAKYDGIAGPLIIEEIDAAGLYCCLTKRDNYLKANFTPFDSILGPDVSFGLALRREGYKNYVDWSITTSHLTKQGEITVSNVKLQQIKFTKLSEDKWEQELL